jgi:hypothetical protein
MAAINSSGLLHSVNNTDMTNPDPSAFSVGLPNSVAVAVNQASKGDSLDAMDVAPATTVTVAPPDTDVANSPAQNAISNAINNDQDVAGVPGMSISPSPSPAPPGYVPGDMAAPATPAAPAAPAAPSVANALANTGLVCSHMTGGKGERARQCDRARAGEQPAGRAGRCERCGA